MSAWPPGPATVMTCATLCYSGWYNQNDSIQIELTCHEQPSQVLGLLHDLFNLSKNFENVMEAITFTCSNSLCTFTPLDSQVPIPKHHATLDMLSSPAFLSFTRCFMQFSLSFLICKREVLGTFSGLLWSLSGLLLTKHLTQCLVPRGKLRKCRLLLLLT